MGESRIPVGAGISTRGPVAYRHLWSADVPHGTLVMADVALYHYLHVPCIVDWRRVAIDQKS